ncbi:hypothetical protein ABPG75_011931 [Micractinium tetrahymenae]
MALAVRASMLSGLNATARTAGSRSLRQQQVRRVAVRASDGQKEQAPAPGGTFFYKGRSYTEAEWKEAVANGTVNQAAATPSYDVSADAPAGDAALSLGQLMAFSGPAPELINGRLAMLAFVAALGAELSTGESVLRQLADEPTGVLLAALAFITASLIPLLNSTKREAFGPFTPAAEMLNGRAAMIGFASLLVAEAVRGSALF